MADKYIWSDPHSGSGGARVPMPLVAKKIADKLTGKKTTIAHAVELLQHAVGKKMKVEFSPDVTYGSGEPVISDTKGAITLQIGNIGQTLHLWRVVKGTKV